LPIEPARSIPPAPFALVLGGARSGKSRAAEALLARHPGPYAYIATATPGDAEMAARIAEHRARRGADWRTIEAPLDLSAALAEAAARPALVDCLTLWLTNLLLADRDWERAAEGLEAALAARAAPTVLVGNEVGLGIVPENALARRFRDAAGLLHQRLAIGAAEVLFMVAGLPMRLK
jgi:adenosyl cobinamide kinase/adenosyl cobinamide phosphate guanylyltransferase